MSNLKRKELLDYLAQLYRADEVRDKWEASQKESFINHPLEGLITPNLYRRMGIGKRCPYCGQKMTYGDNYKTISKQEAIKKGFEYINKQGQT